MKTIKINNPGVATYELISDKSTQLTIRIGYAQAFVLSVYLDNISLMTDQSNPTGMANVQLPGNGITLNGKYIKCYIHVIDTTPETDLTSVFYAFKGGVNSSTFKQTSKAIPSDKIEFFKATFLLYV